MTTDKQLGPSRVVLYFCPECRRAVGGSHNIDSGRKKCSKKWHKQLAVPVEYSRLHTKVGA